MSSFELNIPSASGSYLLVLYLRRGTSLQIGRLGNSFFPRGWYFYAGSAFGPGGLKARLGHHLKPLERFHWHIDYLRSAAELRAIWCQSGVNNEHRWSAELANLSAAELPQAGFGSSDCGCPSHLCYFPRRPKQQQLRSLLGNDKDLKYFGCL